MIGKELPGVHELVYNHMQQCDIEAKELLATNILLIGGCSRIPGLDERFKKEMLNLLPSSAKVSVTVGKENIAWFGASLAASMSTFHLSKITIDKYEESGPNIFIRKAED
jgi:actin-related protein